MYAVVKDVFQCDLGVEERGSLRQLGHSCKGGNFKSLVVSSLDLLRLDRSPNNNYNKRITMDSKCERVIMGGG